MKATLESLHATCAACHGRRTFVRACPFCPDSGHDHECDDTHVSCVAELHLLADQLVTVVEDAAKYRAAEERLNNHAGQAKAAHDSWGSDPDGAVARWVLFGDGEAPAPRETLSKARVVEVLRKWLPPTHAVFEYLGLDTPPSGPGGGVVTEARLKAMQAAAQTAESRWPDDVRLEIKRALKKSSRARIAPTPTQEMANHSCGNCEGVQPETCLANAERFGPRPQSSAPEVVWTGEEERGRRAQVFSDGRIEPAWDNPYSCTEAMHQLARALAEAKREADPVIHALRQYQFRTEVSLTQTLERLVSERVSLQRNAWTNGAESMRERAAKVASGTKRGHLEGSNGWLCADFIENAIRDLPLEES